MPKFNEFLFGSRDKVKAQTTLTPDQQMMMKLIKQGLTKGEGPLGDIFGGFDQEEFDQGVTNPAMKNFQEKILPMLQEKFIGSGQAMGSGMFNAQAQAGSDLQSQLAGLMYQAKQGQKQNKMAGVNTLLGRQGVENIVKQGESGAVQGFIQGAGEGAGKVASAYMMG